MTSESQEIHHELQIDFGPASEVRSESQGFFTHDGASIGEQREKSDDTSPLLPRLQSGF